MGDIVKVEKELKRWLKSTAVSFTVATLVGVYDKWTDICNRGSTA